MAALGPRPALADDTQPRPSETDTCLDVMAEGIGANADNARKDALRAAVSQAVGMLIVASERVEHHALIESRILTYSDGFIQSYEPIGSSTSSDGLIRVRVRACVRRGKLTEALLQCAAPTDAAQQARPVDLRGLQAQAESTLEQGRSAEQMVANLAKGFPACVLKATALEPRLWQAGEKSSVIEIPVRVEVDPERWKAWVEQARRVLEPIALEKGQEVWSVAEGYVDLREHSIPWNPEQSRITRYDIDLWNDWVSRFCDPKSALWWPVGRIHGEWQGQSKLFAGRDDHRSCECQSGLRTFSGHQATCRAVRCVEDRHVIAVCTDPLPNAAPLLWWRLPEACFNRLRDSISWPAVNLTFETADRRPLAVRQVCDWEERISPKRADVSPRVFIRGASTNRKHDAIGRSTLRVGDGDSVTDFAPLGGTGACFNCMLLGQQGEWNPHGPVSLSAQSMLLLPSGMVWVAHQFVRTPVMIFPYHFEVPASEAERIGKATVTVTIRPE